MSTSSHEGIFGFHEFTENKKLWRMLLAELLGTFVLMFIGSAACVNQNTNLVSASVSWGLTVAALVQVLGHISGCHINPAVTVSLFVTGDINMVRSLLFIVVQCAGSTAGTALLYAILPSDLVSTLGMTILAQDVNAVMGLLYEVMYTFLLLFVVHAVSDPGRIDIKGSAPLIIGLTVAAVILSGGPFTGCSVNPARSFGPSVVMNFWEHHWVYWVGPILGGILAGLIYKFIFKVAKSDIDSIV